MVRCVPDPTAGRRRTWGGRVHAGALLPGRGPGIGSEANRVPVLEAHAARRPPRKPAAPHRPTSPAVVNRPKLKRNEPQAASSSGPMMAGHHRDDGGGGRGGRGGVVAVDRRLHGAPRGTAGRGRVNRNDTVRGPAERNPSLFQRQVSLNGGRARGVAGVRRRAGGHRRVSSSGRPAARNRPPGRA